MDIDDIKQDLINKGKRVKEISLLKGKNITNQFTGNKKVNQF